MTNFDSQSEKNSLMIRGCDDKKIKRIFFLLWLLCLAGSWSIIPYVLHLGILPAPVSILKILFLGTLQALVFYGLICFLSYKLFSKTDLRPFSNKNSLKRTLFFGVIPGITTGLAIYLLDKIFFITSPLLIGKIHTPFWIGALASLYGAINEEVILRLFLFTLVYFGFQKIFNSSKKNRLLLLWTTNIIVAIIFGVGHLPAAFKLITPSSFEIFRILLLNGIPGLIFGWLFWSKGLWTAMMAHFVADLMIHVFL